LNHLTVPVAIKNTSSTNSRTVDGGITANQLRAL
jgi:hypothetical protein